MAKKSIVLSNGDSRVTFSNTGSLWFDDVNMAITASGVYADSLKLPSVGDNKLFQVSGSSLVAVQNGLTNKGTLAWNSTLNQWSASADVVEYYSGNAGGDVIGNYGDSENPPKVVNISNVVSGTLRSLNGGTGLSLASGKNVLLKATSAGITAMSASAGMSGSVISAVSGSGWAISPPAYMPDVRFYTSGSSGNTFTWTKPAGAKFARVILQGAGGGGGGGTTSTSSNAREGSGGGSGGFTDIIIELSSINSATVTVGLGGIGGTKPNGGAAGGTTSFLSYTAGGGGGGPNGSGTGGAGGIGLSKNGGYGAGGKYWDGLSANVPAETVYGMPSGGGCAISSGYTYPGPIDPMVSSKSFGYSVDSTGKVIDIPLLGYGAAGNGGNYPPDATNYGSGGAGAPGGPAAAKGSNGAAGYALIISW